MTTVVVASRLCRARPDHSRAPMRQAPPLAVQVAMARPTTSSTTPLRAVLYQLGRVDERFVPGDAPVDLSIERRPLLVGRRDPDSGVQRGRIFVDDPWMSGQHARLVDGPARVGQPGGPPRIFIEDLGSKNGVLINGVAAPRTALLHGDIVETGRTFWVYVEERETEPVLPAAVELGAFVTWHPRLGAQLQDLLSRADSSEHALIVGKDGTGKGFLARTLHQISRRDGRFLHLDCAERRPRKIAVDLFGKEGLSGRLRDAAGGTLLLEHVEVLPLELQVRLADVLLRKGVSRDGRSGHGAVDARVLATISVAPEQLIESGVLDPGLLEVLSGIRVDLPPLVDRLCDLGLLLDDFITRAKGATAISREACRVLFRHRFTQHVRGFARVVEAAASLAVDDDDSGSLPTRAKRRRGTIDVQHLPFSVAGTDAVRALIARANQLAGGDADDAIVKTSTEIPVLSLTGDDESVGDVSSDGGFSSTQQTEAERARLSSAPHRPHTASVMDAGVFAESEEIDSDALATALRAAHGNVSAAARTLGRPRALVLRWLRDLNLDPLSYR